MNNSEFDELAIAFGWDWVDDGMKQDALLKDFIAWAKYRLPTSSHAPINLESLSYVVGGVERYLEGKAPWVKKSGNRLKRAEMWEAYYLCSFKKEFPNALTTRHKDVDGIYSLAGKKLSKSPSAIESLNAKGRTAIRAPMGKQEFCIWYMNSKYNNEEINRLIFKVKK
jgi:hypothetical protein